MSLPFDIARVSGSAIRTCEKLRAAGFSAWIVGGCVRDLVLGREVVDWDIATSARPEQIQKTFRRTVPTGIAHGTISVLDGDERLEVTTFRGEGSYTDGRRPDGVVFLDDIEADLARRDFTVNAIAFDPLTGSFVDPFGGQRDLAAKVLRAVGEAPKRFDEDGLRVLRAARFVATLELEMDPATRDAIPGSLETFRKVSPERVREEWLKTMKAKRPSRAFRVMASTGILGVTFPELAKQVGCPQNRWHAYDVWEHSLHCLDALEGDAVARVAALLHDVGKPRTAALSPETNDRTFYHHEIVGADIASVWLRQYRFSNDEHERIVALIRHHLVCYDDSWSNAAVRRFMKRVGMERVEDLLELARADSLGKGRPVDDELASLGRLRERIAAEVAAQSAVTVRALAVRGNDLMSELGVPAGRAIGIILEELLEEVIETPEKNQRVTLLESARRIAPAAIERAAKEPRAPRKPS